MEQKLPNILCMEICLKELSKIAQGLSKIAQGLSKVAQSGHTSFHRPFAKVGHRQLFMMIPSNVLFSFYLTFQAEHRVAAAAQWQ